MDKNINQKNCILICPHMDDEFFLRDIIESENWNVNKIVFVTDSSSQFFPTIPTDQYYKKRMAESINYLSRYGIGAGKLWFLDFPEQLWHHADTLKRCTDRLQEICSPHKGVIFVPHYGESHNDHSTIGMMFNIIQTLGKIVYYSIYTRPLDSISGSEIDIELLLGTYPSQNNQPPPVKNQVYFSSEHLDILDRLMP